MSGIIVGVDDSGHSRRALEWAIREAVAHHAPLTALTVHPNIESYFGGAVGLPEDHAIGERVRKSVQEEVDRALAKLGVSPESVTVQSIGGNPAEELINASRDADLVVVGSRGAGGFARLAMGSVSNQVTHHAHCPVVIIPPEDGG